MNKTDKKLEEQLEFIFNNRLYIDSVGKEIDQKLFEKNKNKYIEVFKINEQMLYKELLCMNGKRNETFYLQSDDHLLALEKVEYFSKKVGFDFHISIDEVEPLSKYSGEDCLVIINDDISDRTRNRILRIIDWETPVKYKTKYMYRTANPKYIILISKYEFDDYISNHMNIDFKENGYSNDELEQLNLQFSNRIQNIIKIEK